MIAILAKQLAVGQRWVAQHEHVTQTRGRRRGFIRHVGGHEEEFIIVTDMEQLRGLELSRVVNLGVSREMQEMARSRVRGVES